MSNPMTCPNCNRALDKNPALDMWQCPTCPFNLMPNQKVLPQLYAWLSVDPKNGYEGLIASQLQKDGPVMALVSSNIKVMEDLKHIAQSCVDHLGLTAHLVHFKRVGVVNLGSKD